MTIAIIIIAFAWFALGALLAIRLCRVAGES